jgi:hypothetical protein
MPGLTVVDGTPRDCPSAGCGAQDDTAVIRANELGTAKASAMGRTKAGGPVTATKMMAVFMDGASGNVTAREIHEMNSLYRRQLFGGGKAAAGSVKTPGTYIRFQSSWRISQADLCKLEPPRQELQPARALAPHQAFLQPQTPERSA